ncbi:hypothetical protein BDV12DRAFT_152303 [Aspergillus spectabilis]
MHPQIIPSLVLLGSVSLATANDIVSLILPQFDEQDLVGEVIGSNGPMTTYVINCPDGTDAVDCGMPPDGMTVTAASTAFIFDYTFEDYWLHQSCEHRGTTWFSCAITNTQSDFSSVTSLSESVELPYLAVTITATATDAEDSTETTTTSADSSSSTSSDSESASVTPAPSESASPTSDAEDAEETNSDNAAVSLPTGSTAQWLVSGAGMAIALALA